MMDISIIIVNYNSAKVIKTCLDSILSQRGVDFEIIVVDNSSHDNSLELIANYDKRVMLIENHRNVGFGRANNIGFKYARGRYVYLINPDACLQTSDDLQCLMRLMQEHPKYGLLGTRIVNTDGSKETESKFCYPGEKKIKPRFANLPGDIAWVLGASMFMRRDIYDEVGGFDEDYFLYAEEADLCLRIRELGYQIAHTDEVTIKHIGAVSERTNGEYGRWCNKQKGKYTFYRKHYDLEQSKFLVKKELRQARFRYRTYCLRKLITSRHQRCENRRQRYKAIYDSAREFLA